MSALVEKIPYEAWDGKNPSMAHRVFGCDVFVHIPKVIR
jgi:hypothetical protein